MSDRPSPARSVESTRGIGERILHWLLLDGSRQAVTAGVVLAVFLLTFALVTPDAIAIGPSSTAGTAFASGLVAGTLTLVTVALVERAERLGIAVIVTPLAAFIPPEEE